MFAIKCYGFPGYDFTHFRMVKTLTAAKKAAAAAIAESWRMVEILKQRKALDEVDWKVLETIERE